MTRTVSMPRLTTRFGLLPVLVLASLALFHSVAAATVPGVNGRLAYGVWGSPTEVKHEIFTVRTSGTGNRRLPLRLASAPQWSPNGRLVAFTRDVTGIWTARAGGQAAKRVIPIPERGTSVEMPGWAPDGRRIAFVSGWEERSEDDPERLIERRFIYAASVDGSSPQQLREGNWPSWSPDGRRIAYVGTDFRAIALMDANGSNAAIVSSIPAGRLVGAIDFSPDGRRLLFTERRFSGDGDRVAAVLRILNLRTRRIRTVAVRSGLPVAAVWAPNGRRIACVVDPVRAPGSGRAASEIWTMRPDGSDQRRRFTLPRNRWAESLSWQARPRPAGKVRG